jgi:predicted RNA binding protein YcfA (HicA-like mRNA interferase family)
LTNIFICVIISLTGGVHLTSYSSKEIISWLQADGWYLMTIEGSHHHFKHPTKQGKTTVKHPCKDIPPKTLRNIEKQSGLSFR